jgi:DedD protein
VEEPRTHYQVSFTSRQGLAVFVALVAAIVLAYFLGLMTGLAGSQARPPAASAAASGPVPGAPSESIAEAPFPAPVLGVSGRTPAARPPGAPVPRPTETSAPAATPSIQLFEDRASADPTPRPTPIARAASTPGRPSARPSPASGFWVQVDSLSTKDQAEARRRNVAAAGFPAAVVPGAGPRGPVFRVRVGPYATREEAERAKEGLSRKAKVANPWIVPPGQ